MPSSLKNGKSPKEELGNGSSETTPLLAGPSDARLPPRENEEDATNEDVTVKDIDKPLDKIQIFALCYGALVDPISFFCIVPFVNQMIFDTKQYPETDVGFYSGLIESLFSVTQMITMIPWGRVADRYGRKPVLVFSLWGLAVTVSMFGFSKTVWQMILLRCAAGLFSGSVLTIRAMISENSTPKTQATAFSIMAFFRNMGIFVGTLIGGLADPANQYKSIFGGVKFFEDHPYAFPTLISGAFAGSAAIISILFVKETLDPEKVRDNSSEHPPLTTWEIIKSPGVSIVLFIWSIALLLGMAFTAVVPVYWFTSINTGGFGFQPKMISRFLALSGISQAIWLILVFPRLQRRIGTGGVLRACAVVWPFLFLFMPLGNLVLRKHLFTVFWTVAPAGIAIGSGCAMAFTAVQLAVNDISPSPTALGTLNGIALSLSSGVRAFTPGLFTSIYAAGLRSRLLGGQLIWGVMIAVTLIYGFSLQWLPEKAEGKLPRETHDDTEE